MASIPTTTIAELRERHAVLLLDAYGVLVDAERALDGAAELVERLNRSGSPYFVLTNDASRSPRTASARYRGHAIDVPPERIITSGSLLSPYFRECGLEGAGCLVLGTEDSLEYVRDAGGRIVSFEEAAASTPDALVVADEAGYPFLESIDLALSVVLRCADQSRPIRLILPNPDLIYPKSEGRFGFAAGSVALLIEAALRIRHPDRADLAFVPLGKPHQEMFAEAARRAGTRDMVMIGDQLETDVRGARDFGIASALVTYGVTRSFPATSDLRPDYLLSSL